MQQHLMKVICLTQLLIKYGHKDAADCDGCIVPKKTYLLINDLIKSVNRKEYGIGHTA